MVDSLARTVERASVRPRTRFEYRIAASLPLRFGSAGALVVDMQQKLKHLGYPVGPQDGLFGPLTRAALRAYQRDHGVADDGVFTPELATRLASPETGRGLLVRDATSLSTPDTTPTPEPSTPHSPVPYPTPSALAPFPSSRPLPASGPAVGEKAGVAPAGPWRTLSLSMGTLHVPPGLPQPGKPLDFVIHMHGGHGIPFKEMPLDKAVITMQKPGLSSGYVPITAARGTLDRWLAEASARLPGARPGRVALSSFSGGFSGVRNLLKDPAALERIDTVVLLDGLHTGYSRDRLPTDAGMEPFRAFARLAAAGQKTFVVTHTAIVPPDYASTTETADDLIRAVGASRSPYAGPTSPDGITPSSEAHAGNLHVYGFEGGDAAAHVRALRHGRQVWQDWIVR